MTRHPSNTFTVAPGITVGCITADSITTVATDGIVNAANVRLRGGSGVNGAIHRRDAIQVMVGELAGGHLATTELITPLGDAHQPRFRCWS